MGTLSNDINSLQTLPGSFSPNLFEVAWFGHEADGDKSAYTGSGYTATMLLNCSKVSIPGLTLNYDERHKVFKESFFKDVKMPDEVSFTWLENHKLDVWTYHQDWFACYYNRKLDVFVSKPAGKKRIAQILIRDIPTALGEDGPVLHTFQFEGLQPTSMNELALDWAGGGEAPQITMKYRVDRIKYKAGSATEWRLL
jgi:hypothetical protein